MKLLIYLKSHYYISLHHFILSVYFTWYYFKEVAIMTNEKKSYWLSQKKKTKKRN